MLVEPLHQSLDPRGQICGNRRALRYRQSDTPHLLAGGGAQRLEKRRESGEPVGLGDHQIDGQTRRRGTVEFGYPRPQAARHEPPAVGAHLHQIVERQHEDDAAELAPDLTLHLENELPPAGFTLGGKIMSGRFAHDAVVAEPDLERSVRRRFALTVGRQRQPRAAQSRRLAGLGGANQHIPGQSTGRLAAPGRGADGLERAP